MTVLVISASVLLLCLVAFVVISRMSPFRAYPMLNWVYGHLFWLWPIAPRLDEWLWRYKEGVGDLANQEILQDLQSKNKGNINKTTLSSYVGDSNASASDKIQIITSLQLRASGGDPASPSMKVGKQIIKDIEAEEEKITDENKMTGDPSPGVEDIPDEEVPERSPFCIQDFNRKTAVRVYFMHLEPQDYPALQSNAWQVSQVHSSQRDFVNFFSNSHRDNPAADHQFWKIVRANDPEKCAEGLLWIAKEFGNCYLVVAPWNQFEVSERRYSGVGKALVGRLVLESRRRGQHGAFAIVAAPDAVDFYNKLNFYETPGALGTTHDITAENANSLLQQVYCSGSLSVTT